MFPGPIQQQDVVAVYATLACLYGVTAGVSLVQFVRHLRNSDASNRTSSQFITHVFVSLTLVARLVCNSVLPFLVNMRVFFVLDTFPSMFSYSAFMFVIAFWADLYYKSRGTTPTFIRFFVAFTIIFYTGAVIVYTLYVTLQTPEQFELMYKAVIGCGIVITAVLVVGGAIFGYLTFRTLRDFPVVLPAVKRLSRKVGIVAVICVLCFLIRSLVLGITAALQASNLPDVQSALASAPFFISYSVLYPIVAEIFPLSLLMYFMGVAERADGSPGESQALFVAPEQPAQLERMRSYSKTPMMGSPDYHGSSVSPYRSM